MPPLTRVRRLLRRDDGNAAIEFLVAGVVLLIPLVYLGLALAAIQGGSLAAEGAAREAARVYVSSTTDATGRTNANRAVTVALADRRLLRHDGDLELRCDVAVADCLAAGRRVTATVRTEVDLPFVPPIFGLDRVARVPIEATATAPIFRLGAAP
jgi:Flp pilus assembly protein TadG